MLKKFSYFREKIFTTQSFADTLLLDRSFSIQGGVGTEYFREKIFTTQSFADTLLLDRSFFPKIFYNSVFCRHPSPGQVIFPNNFYYNFFGGPLKFPFGGPKNSGALGYSPLALLQIRPCLQLCPGAV